MKIRHTKILFYGLFSQIYENLGVWSNGKGVLGGHILAPSHPTLKEIHNEGALGQYPIICWGKHCNLVYCHKYSDFTPNFVCIILRYHSKPFISVWLKRQVRKSPLILCAFESLATKLQRFWVSPAINLLQHWNDSVVNFWAACNRMFWCDWT